MRSFYTTVALASLLALPGAVWAKDKQIPSWVGEVASRPLPAYSGKVPAVVLFNEERAVVSADGGLDTVTRHAVKIVNHDGIGEASVVEYYEKNGRQVKDLRAWLVSPDGSAETLDKNSIEDLGAYDEDLYNDIRLRRIRVRNPEIGSVFAYESEVVEKLKRAQDRFFFQSELPSLESRYVLTLPAGWAASGRVLNHESIRPTVDGGIMTWVLKDLPYREYEEHAPRRYGTAPILAIDLQPPTALPDLTAFTTWTDVSRWQNQIAEGRADLSPEMQSKARELTAGMPAELDRIRAIAHYVQQIRYVEIAMDLAHNGGYRPHLASQVFSRHYGDCKDKANLMLAMLRAAGIKAHLVAIYSGDRTYVKQAWASPYQFNHMILAAEVGQPTTGATVMDSPVGRILLFDPTDERTPLGDLPSYEQGSFALLCAGEKGALIQMPVLAPEANLLSEEVKAVLDAEGNLQAVLTRSSTGQAARRERYLSQSTSPEQLKAALERHLNLYAKSPSVADVRTQDRYNQDGFSLDLKFASEHYAQVMRNKLMVVNVAMVRPESTQLPPVQKRTGTIVLDGSLYRKHVQVQLPEGFSVDEMPVPFKAESPFARFSITYRKENGSLFLDEELRTETVTLPPSEYAVVKKFFDDVLGADSQSAVLVKN